MFGVQKIAHFHLLVNCGKVTSTTVLPAYVAMTDFIL